MLFLLLLAILGASVFVARDINQSSRQKFVEDAIPLKAAVQNLVLQVVNQQSAVRAYLITRSERNLPQYSLGRAAANRDLASIRARLDGHPVMARLIVEAEPQIAALERYFASQVALARSGAAGLRTAQARVAYGTQLFSRFRVTAARMQADTVEFVRDAQRAQDSHYTILLVILGLLGAGALLAAVWIALKTDRGALRSMIDLDEARTGMQRALDRERAASAEVDALIGRLQQSLLPALVLDDDEVRVATLYRPGERRLQLGGDFYDCIQLVDGTIALLIGDVSGHGPNAAALGASLRTAWRGLALRDETIPRVLACLQAVFERERENEEAFATACYGLIDPARAHFSFALAGHPSPFLVGDEATVTQAPPGPPLGVFEEPDWPVTVVSLPPEAAVILYTDGLIEGRAEPRSEERFGQERLAQMVARYDPARVDEEALQALARAAAEANGGPLPDDVAILGLVLGSSRDGAEPARATTSSVALSPR